MLNDVDSHLITLERWPGGHGAAADRDDSVGPVDGTASKLDIADENSDRWDGDGDAAGLSAVASAAVVPPDDTTIPYVSHVVWYQPLSLPL